MRVRWSLLVICAFLVACAADSSVPVAVGTSRRAAALERSLGLRSVSADVEVLFPDGDAFSKGNKVMRYNIVRTWDGQAWSTSFTPHQEGTAASARNNISRIDVDPAGTSQAFDARGVKMNLDLRAQPGMTTSLPAAAESKRLKSINMQFKNL